MRREKVFSVFSITISLIIAFTAIFPLAWMLLSGFKSSADVLAVPFKFFPTELHTENYTGLFTGQVDSTIFPEGASFVRSIFLTLFVSSVSVVLSIVINSMAGYVFARLNFPFKNIIWVIYLMPWFVPGISTYITQFEVVSGLKMLDTLMVLIIPGIVHSYSIFFYRQFYLNIPESLEEAAKLDGASFLTIYTRIFFPMSATPFTIMGISVFLGYWSSFLWPIMTVSDTALFQINQLISYFKSAYNSNMHLVMAASTVAAVPTIIIFLSFQGKIMQGIKISGIK